MNGTLSFYECRFGGGGYHEVVGQSNTTLCKRICLNFLNSQVTLTKNFGCEFLHLSMSAPFPSHLMEFPRPIFSSIILFLHECIVFIVVYSQYQFHSQM